MLRQEEVSLSKTLNPHQLQGRCNIVDPDKASEQYFPSRLNLNIITLVVASTYKNPILQ